MNTAVGKRRMPLPKSSLWLLLWLSVVAFLCWVLASAPFSNHAASLHFVGSKFRCGKQQLCDECHESFGIVRPSVHLSDGLSLCQCVCVFGIAKACLDRTIRIIELGQSVFHLLPPSHQFDTLKRRSSEADEVEPRHSYCSFTFRIAGYHEMRERERERERDGLSSESEKFETTMMNGKTHRNDQLQSLRTIKLQTTMMKDQNSNQFRRK